MACTIDFRRLDEGFGGKTYKRKRSLAEQGQVAENEEAMMDVEIGGGDPASKRQAVASSSDPNKPVGRATYARESGRKWKAVRTKRSSAVRVSVKRTSLEQRKKEKEIKKAYQERKKELKEEIRMNKVEKRRKKEEREKRKKENVLRSGTKLQKITNPNTLKKMSKSAKDRKLLKVVPAHVLQPKHNDTTTPFPINN